jgi:hypothetical protein
MDDYLDFVYAFGSLDYQLIGNNNKPQLFLTVTQRLYDTVVNFKDIF